VRGGRQAESSKPSGHAQRMFGGQQWRAGVVAQPSIAAWLTGDAAYRQRRRLVCNSQQGTAVPCHVDIYV